jgi:hypothetical protein
MASCGGGNGATAPARSTATTSPHRPSSTTGPAPAGPCGTATSPPNVYDHVVWIWMENHTAADVLGSGDAPFTTGLAAACGHAARYGSVGSPSLPNYLGATSGDTHGIQDDAGPSAHPITSDNLFRQVRTAGHTARSYEESMSGPCQLDSSGDYAVKHNPAAYYEGGDDRRACQTDDVPLGSLAAGAFLTALDAGTLPGFSFVTPNLCHDTHDCSVRTGDDWLRQFLGPLLASATYRRGRTAVFVVWDEPTPMPFVAVSPTTPPGSVAQAPADHYSLLRTTEELLGLPPLGHAATAASLRAALGL